VMTKLNRRLLDKATGQLNTSFQIYLGIYQAIISEDGQDNLYEKFDRDFFDLIVIDECHRGSAKDDSNWRQVLDYFGNAVQVGLTATPKETKYASNIDYFGKPIFIYSLKQGIEDGFLAPFRVIRVDLDKDKEGWKPSPGQRDDKGELIEDRVFNLKDFDRNITFAQRTDLVASYVSHFLHDGDPMRKTIVFCEQIDQAEEMRQALVNVDLNKELVQQDHRYVMRITGDEKEGKAQLDNFINPKEDFPVIATTSKLMTTGVDAQTCHVIVLDRQIKSMTEFKQIIGRGTRLRPDYDKNFFTIIDFRGATDLFKDEDWDGPPIQDEDFGHDPPGGGAGSGELPPSGEGGEAEGEEGRPPKYQVGSEAFAIARERTSVYDGNGKLTQESLRDYTRKRVEEEYASLDQFIKRWNAAEQKQAILDELQQQNVPIEALEQMVGAGYDPLDLICHVAFDQPPLTRRERAEQVRKRDVFTKYGPQARAVLEALLEKYADQGVKTIENREVLKLEPFAQMGTVVELVGYFGGKRGYLRAVQELEKELYEGEGA
jgi:type I restriction enzyme, R subunit